MRASDLFPGIFFWCVAEGKIPAPTTSYKARIALLHPLVQDALISNVTTGPVPVRWGSLETHTHLPGGSGLLCLGKVHLDYFIFKQGFAHYRMLSLMSWRDTV